MADTAPTPLLEYVMGSMSVLRMGPVSIPLHSSAKVTVKSEMLLVLRLPRVEVQTESGTIRNPDWCEILEMRIDGELLHADHPESLGVILPGQTLEALLVNDSKQIGNATVVIEGDVARIVHMGIECGKNCEDCRWQTSCHHEECERSPEAAQKCEGTRTASFMEMIDTDGPIYQSWNGRPRLNR